MTTATSVHMIRLQNAVEGSRLPRRTPRWPRDRPIRDLCGRINLLLIPLADWCYDVLIRRSHVEPAMTGWSGLVAIPMWIHASNSPLMLFVGEWFRSRTPIDPDAHRWMASR